MATVSAARTRWPLRSLTPCSPAAGTEALSVILDAKHQPAADAVRFDKPHGDFISEPIDTTGRSPRQLVPSLVSAVIIAWQGRYRNEPVGSGLLQRNEKPEIGNAADAGGKDVAHPPSEECRTVPIDSGPLGSRRAPLGR